MELKLQNLPAQEAHFCLHICKFLEEIAFNLQDKKLLVAFSAGLDSTALLLFFSLMQAKYNLKLKAVHIHHGIREEANLDSQKAEEIAKKLNIPFTLIYEDVPALAKVWKKGLEETGRIVRYENFDKILQEENFNYITLGHHLNDLVEDSLMRQIRGTSLDESLGMQALDSNRKLIRPFLCTEKARLKQFVEACNIEWIEDSSNNSNDYTRNRIRNTLLPLILEENPNYYNTIANNWRQAQYDKEYWQEKLNIFTKDLFCISLENTFSIDRALFCKEQRAVRLRILASILKKFGSIPESRLLFSIDELILKKESIEFKK